MSENEASSSENQDAFAAFRTLACAGDLEGMRVMVENGFNLKALDKGGDTVLECVIRDLSSIEDAPRHLVIQEMLRLGADATQHNTRGCGPLFAAVLDMDAEMLGILLEAGADPNQEKMDSSCESLYDWAEFDYRYEAWGLTLPDEPTEEDRRSEQTWLHYLDRIAVQHGKPRPLYLQRLRQGGALSMNELNAASCLKD